MCRSIPRDILIELIQPTQLLNNHQTNFTPPPPRYDGLAKVQRQSVLLYIHVLVLNPCTAKVKRSLRINPWTNIVFDCIYIYTHIYIYIYDVYIQSLTVFRVHVYIYELVQGPIQNSVVHLVESSIMP